MEIDFEEDIVASISFQDPQMMSAFDYFPDVLIDATCKINN